MYDLDRLTAFIRNHWTFDARSYPELNGKTPEETFAFAVRHCALHFGKTAGKVIAVSEGKDHGSELDLEELKRQTSKMLINVLMLASLLGMTGDDLIRFMEEKYKDRIE